MSAYRIGATLSGLDTTTRRKYLKETYIQQAKVIALKSSR